MRMLVGIAGAAMLLATLWDAFETIILPRRVTRSYRMARLFYRVTWRLWSGVAVRLTSRKFRESLLSYFGPLSMLGLFALWAVILVLGFALLQWANGSAVGVAGEETTWFTDLYLSGTTFFTLGLGDVTPRTMLARMMTVAEAGTGFAFLAVIISYLPTLYTAFSQRELNISLLDARAGSPPTAAELLRRHAHFPNAEVLTQYLRDWESWSGQLMESHLSYPVLCYFRSQHDNQSWLAAFAAIMDVSALLIAYGAGTVKWQAQLTFAISRHAIADLCQVLRVRPVSLQDRLPAGDLTRVRTLLVNYQMADLTDSGDVKLRELRSMYEPYLHGLSRRLLMPLPSWGVGGNFVESSTTTAWGRISSEPGSVNTPTDDDSEHF